MNNETEYPEGESPELEEIMREFSAPEEAPGMDPALRTPIIRRDIVEEDLPERHIPKRPVEEEKPQDRIITIQVERKPEEEEPTREEPSGIPLLDREKPAVRERKPRSKIRSMPKLDRFRPDPEEKPEEPSREDKPEPKPEPVKAKKPKPILTPEARWKQALEHQGTRNVRLMVSFILTVGALFLGFVRSQGMLDGYPHQELFGMGELFLMFMCAVCAFDVLNDGIRRLASPGFGLDTLVLVETVAALCEGYYAMEAQRASLAPLMCLILSCAIWGKRSRVQAEAETMDAARKLDGNHALVREPGYFQKQPGLLYGSGNMKDFLMASDEPVTPEKFLNFYSFLVVLAGLAIATLNFGGEWGKFFQYWTSAMLAGTPLMSFLIWSRPWAILAKKMKERGAAIYGWPGVRRLCGKVTVPVSERDLFPNGNVKMNGVKFFNGQLPDRVVAFGAAVTAAAGSALAPIFEEQMQLRAARRFSVSTLRRYDVGGIGAEIGSESVLVGSLRFMQSMGVEMPGGTRVSQAVYVAIGGDLAGVFALHYGVTRASVENMAVLCANRGVVPVITAGDFIITESFLRSKFRMNTAGVRLPSMSVRAQLEKKKPGEKALPAVLVKEPDFFLLVSAITGARALNMAYRTGLILTVFSSLMGMVIMGVLAGLSAGGIMSVANLTLFLLIWSVPMFLLTGWPKNV